VQLLRQYSCIKIFQNQTVTKEKLRKTLSYEKIASKMLTKLTPILLFGLLFNDNFFL